MDIERIRLEGLEGGIEGFVSPETARELIVPTFEYKGFTYHVRPSGYNVWIVTKLFPNGGDCMSEYDVRSDGGILTCGCFQGRKHRDCRHKAMVMAICARTRPRPKVQTRPRVVPKPKPRPVRMDPAMLDDARKTLESARAALRR